MKRMVPKKLRSVGVLILFVLCSKVAWAHLASNPFHVAAVPAPASAKVGDTITLQLEIAVPPGHYLYQDATTLYFVKPAGFTVKSIHYPAAEQKEDEFQGKVVAIYPHNVLIDAELIATQSADSLTLNAVVTYQGCSQSICFRRMEEPVAWQLHVTANGADTAAPPSSQQPAVTLDTTHAPPSSANSWSDFLTHPSVEKLFRHGHTVAYVLTFLGGVLTSFTPCVLPMIPVILLIIGIQPGIWRRNLWLSTCLGLGVACTAAAIGTIAAVIGLPIAFIFEQRWFIAVVILLFLLMALAMFGLFTIRLPYALQNRLQHLGGKGPRGAFFAGVSTGLLATPCAGPVVAALVAYVGVSGNVLYGFSLLLTYGVGFAVIFILVGTFYGQLAGRLPHGAAVRLAKFVLGILLLIPAGYYSWVLFGSTTTEWYTDVQAAYTLAQQSHRPLVLEFTAKSCPPCLVMEQTTFHDAAVLQALHNKVVPLRLDMTFPTKENLALADRYGVVGWPALIFLAPDGAPLTDLFLLGKIAQPEELLNHITQAAARVK